MAKFCISYRAEFGAEVEAKDIDEAMKKFESGDCKINVIGGLHPEYFEVTDEEGQTLKEMGW